MRPSLSGIGSRREIPHLGETIHIPGQPLSVVKDMIRSAEAFATAEGSTCRTSRVRVCRTPRCLRNPRTCVYPTSGLRRASVRPGCHAGAEEERREPESMANGLKRPDPAIAPANPANRGTSVPAEPLEERAGLERIRRANAGAGHMAGPECHGRLSGYGRQPRGIRTRGSMGFHTTLQRTRRQ